MASNRVWIDATPEVVSWVLTDVASYPLWVVGAKRIRAVDAEWPAAGSAFHHVMGVGPVEERDSTRILEHEPEHRLVLLVQARPLVGRARVELTLTGRAGGTDLVMEEWPVDGPLRRLDGIAVELVVGLRNWWSLRRLRSWCEQRQRAMPGARVTARR